MSLRKKQGPDQNRLPFLVEKCDIDVLAGAAGTITMVDSHHTHGSGDTITPLPRSNVFAVCNSVRNPWEGPYVASE